MILFADSSAIVTQYAPAETALLPDRAVVIVSALARVEVVSALWRKVDPGGLRPTEAATLVRRFEADCGYASGARPRYEFIELRARTLRAAAALTGTHRLRSLDAIQLACAIAARDAEPECRTMAVLDARLRQAAAAERFDILPA